MKNHRTTYLLFGFITGATVLSFFSIFQKTMLGADPFALIGFIVPVLFGGSAGATIANFIFRHKQMNAGLQEQIDKKVKSFQSLLDEKEMLLKEVHHRIKNNMTVIRSLLYLHVNERHNDNTINEAIAKIDSMNVLYEQLFLSENYDVSSVKEYVNNLMDKFSTIFPDKAHIVINKEIEELKLTPNIIFPLGLLLNELFTNSMKYAFEGRSDGEIDVRLIKKNNEAILTYKDDGVGIPQELLKHKAKGFGFRLIDLLCKQIEAEYQIKSINGTEIIIKFSIHPHNTTKPNESRSELVSEYA